MLRWNAILARVIDLLSVLVNLAIDKAISSLVDACVQRTYIAVLNVTIARKKNARDSVIIYCKIDRSYVVTEALVKWLRVIGGKDFFLSRLLWSFCAWFMSHTVGIRHRIHLIHSINIHLKLHRNSSLLSWTYSLFVRGEMGRALFGVAIGGIGFYLKSGQNCKIVKLLITLKYFWRS